MFKAFLIKYGEIGVKGKNRYLFEDALVNQIKFALREVEGRFKDLLDSTLRFSFCADTTIEEIDYCLEAIRELLPVLKKYRAYQKKIRLAGLNIICQSFLIIKY